MTPHEEFHAFLKRVKRLSRQRRKQRLVLYRASEPQYARQGDRLMGVGACQYGGRWNPIGVRAVYGSPTPEIAMAEALANHRHYGLPIHCAMPKEFFAFKADLRRVLDLTDGKTRQRLRLSIKRMNQCPWRESQRQNQEPLTQVVGRTALLAGFEAIKTPSAQVRPHGFNIVVFPDQPGVPERLTTLNADQI